MTLFQEKKKVVIKQMSHLCLGEITLNEPSRLVNELVSSNVDTF
jgi:hypothetical protein